MEERLFNAVIEGDWLRWVNSAKPNRRAMSFTSFREGYMCGHRRATGKTPNLISPIFSSAIVASVSALIGLVVGMFL